jgi:glycosyltransferase involved in cell wall biosynthesis
MHPAFSILIPTWNNLPFLKLCVESIRKNSRAAHQIILHINEGADGTLEYARKQNIEYSHSAENIGVCRAVNQASKLAKTDFIAYFNDDMYACPEWDQYLWDEIQAIGTDLFFLSATMIEPVLTRNRCVISPLDYGSSPDNFREKNLLHDFPYFVRADWCGATWPPNIVHRGLWEKVGGYSEEFSPGLYSDPDFSKKLWDLGVRYFKGVGKSRVYHFMSKTMGKLVAKNDGRRLFLKKWGLASSTFTKFYLRQGRLWTGPLKDPVRDAGFYFSRTRDFIKRFF